MWCLYIVILLITLGYSLYYHATRSFNYWKIRNVAGPNPVPLFGNVKDSALRKKNIGEVFEKIYNEFPKEKIVGVYRMTTPSLLLRDLDIIKNVLVKDFDYFSDRGFSFSSEGLGANLFQSESDIWRVLRAHFTPIFTTGKLKNMVYLLEQCGDKFINYIEKVRSIQTEQEVHSLVQKYTMATISSCAFGLEFDTISDKTNFFTHIDELTFSPSYIDELDMMYPWVFKTIKLEPYPKKILHFFEDIVKTVVAQRNGVSTSRKDFMDAILELRQQREFQVTNKLEGSQKSLELTDTIIAAQVFGLYAAGYETSATTMSFMLYELAKNLKIQNKLIAEVDEVLKKHNDQLSYEAIMELTYMEKVLNETLRLYPIVDPLQRNAQMDYTIPGTNVTIKKDQIVLISTLGIHHDEKYYPNPKKFDPERFSPENISKSHSCAYLPFGTGPRNCIGMRFAKFQSIVCLTKFFTKYRVEPSEKTMPTISFVPRRVIMAAKDGIYLNIVPRNK